MALTGAVAFTALELTALAESENVLAGQLGAQMREAQVVGEVQAAVLASRQPECEKSPVEVEAFKLSVAVRDDLSEEGVEPHEALEPGAELVLVVLVERLEACDRRL